MGSTRTSGLSTVHFPSVILHGAPITLLMASLSRIPNEALCTVVSHSKPFFRFLGSVVTRLASTFSPNGTNSCGGFFRASSQMVSFHLDLSGTWTGCTRRASTNHGMTGDSSPSDSICSDDSTNQHHCVLNEPVPLFVSFHCILCGDFCFAQCSLNAIIAGSVSLFNVISRYPANR